MLFDYFVPLFAMYFILVPQICLAGIHPVGRYNSKVDVMVHIEAYVTDELRCDKQASKPARDLSFTILLVSPRHL